MYLIFNTRGNAQEALALIESRMGIPFSREDGYMMDKWTDVVELPNGKFAVAKPDDGFIGHFVEREVEVEGEILVARDFVSDIGEYELVEGISRGGTYP